MSKGRLEAFSDAVIAILITIMVLELRPPHEHTLEGLWMVAPIFMSYVLSFLYLAVYWNNHHHLFQAVQRIDGRVLWANMGLLFCLSLIPFVTSWMGETGFDTWPVAVYGVVLVLAAVAYYGLVHTLLRLHTSDSALAHAIGNDFKGKISLVIYVVAIALAFVNPWLSFALYLVVGTIWFIPDRRIEKNLAK